jgi:hypothetical protein
MSNQHIPARPALLLSTSRQTAPDGAVSPVTDPAGQTAPRPAIPVELRRLAAALGRQAARADLGAYRPTA